MQILSDAAAVVVLFIIALKLVPPVAAIIAGVLAAISPQFAYSATLLLPDSLVALPILLAVYFAIRGLETKRLANFLAAGALIGVSCWLRGNALLLAPFLAAGAFLLVERGGRLRAATAILGGDVAVIAPITIKNAIVFHRFIPLSLGAGQTLLIGIADYDHEGRFNIPVTDMGLMRQEAEWYRKPEYARLYFGEDGIERDRMRLARSFRIIRSHPFWFAGVVARRGVDSTRLDPVPVLARESPVSHDFARTDGPPVWTSNEWIRLQGNDAKYGTLMASDVINLQPGVDYVFRVPVKLEQGACC